MARNKPIPRSQRNTFNRGTKLSRNNDDVKNVSVGIMDMDSAIMYYFNEVIKPQVEVNEEKVNVPCIYASPERWNQISKQGFLLSAAISRRNVFIFLTILSSLLYSKPAL